MTEFVNQTLAALANPKRGFATYNKSKQGDWQIRQQQQRLVKATKFSVSDSLLAHAVKASFVPPAKLLAACELAVPPFENMWIEWDSHLQREMMAAEYASRGIEYGNVGREGGLARVAYHIDVVRGLPCYNFFGIEDPTDDLFFISHGVYLRNESVITPSEMLSRRHVDYRKDITHQDIIDQQKMYGMHLLSRHYVGLWAGQPECWPDLDRLYHRMAFGTHVLGQVVHPDISEGMRPDYAHRLFEGALNTITGDMRLLIVLLALVNYPHHVFERKLDAGIPKIAYGRRVPRNEVRVLEIDLPKPRGVKKYERMFTDGKGAPRRQHVRRGHWRTYHHKDGRVTRRWIKEQIVGNASVGIIDHEYELVKKGTDR